MRDLATLAIARLRAAWDEPIRPSSRRALVALLFGALVVCAHLARVGTAAARVSAVAGVGFAIVFIVLRAVFLRRDRRDPRTTVRKVVGSIDRELAGSTLRAMTLAKRTTTDDVSGSPELAELHLSRLIGRASTEKIGERAEARAAVWSIGGLVVALSALGAVIIEPFRIVEGLDVLAAHKARDEMVSRAPLDLTWLEDVEMTATPPEYLRSPATPFSPFYAVSKPRGTTFMVRGRPTHAGRNLVITDGVTSAPFVDDGSGDLVARYVLGDSTDLYVAAKFGDVIVRQPDVQTILSIPDLAPVVTVEGAPRTVRLLDEPDIAIHYEATDDHGLREVDLVLRSGQKEERRVLSRPAADAVTDRGGYELRSNDAFLKRIYTPVEVVVEARDNDLVSGPKWGKSPAILVVPPQVGEPEALRYQALLRARDALTDLVADRIEQKPPDAKSRAEHLKHENEIHDKAFSAVSEVLDAKYGGLSLRGRPAKLVLGQLRRLRDALDAEAKSPTAAAHEKLLDESERVLLAVDAGVRGLGARDTQAVAKRLADVADEVASAALGAEEAGPGAKRDANGKTSFDARMDASVGVLDGGGKHMLKLGELGLDLGEIVAADLRRIARAREAKDMHHAELAARDLAARLRRPNPSFGGGGGGGHGGVESGASGQDAGDASEADKEQQKADDELERLARDHEAEEQDVSDALDRASSPEELQQLKEEMKEHAKNIREAVKSLPQSGGDPGSAEGQASAGREASESMAGELERGSPAAALKSGKEAQQALGEAHKLGEQASGFFPEERAGKEAAKARETIQRELAWTQEQVDKLRKNASKRAEKDLKDAGKGEGKLGDRAKELAQKGQTGDRSMPEEQLDRLQQAEQKMREAERALKEGDGETGLQKQDEAQRLLEMAQGESEQPNDSNRDQDGASMARKTEVPGKDQHKGPDEFRKRVMEGLGGSSDPILREAVKRYAEGLLK